MVKLQEELEEIRGTTEVLARELAASQGELTDEQRKIARLRGDLSALSGKFQSSNRSPKSRTSSRASSSPRSRS